MRNEQDIIEALGGTGALSRILGINQSAVANWYEWGIPRGRWPDLIRIARDDKINVDLDVLFAVEATRMERRMIAKAGGDDGKDTSHKQTAGSAA